MLKDTVELNLTTFTYTFTQPSELTNVVAGATLHVVINWLQGLGTVTIRAQNIVKWSFVNFFHSAVLVNLSKWLIWSCKKYPLSKQNVLLIFFSHKENMEFPTLFCKCTFLQNNVNTTNCCTTCVCRSIALLLSLALTLFFNLMHSDWD